MQKSILFCRDPGLTSLVHEHGGSKYLLNARYLGHETILCFGEPGSLGTYFLRQQKSHAVDDSEIPNQTTTRFHQFHHSKKGCILTTFFSNSIEPGTSDLFQTCHLLTFWCFFLEEISIFGNFHLRGVCCTPQEQFFQKKIAGRCLHKSMIFSQVLGCRWLEVRIARVIGSLGERIFL